MISLKKPLFIQNINTSTVFTIIVWLLIAWVLARPLKGIGEYTYSVIGSLVNSTFEEISQSKLQARELIQSREHVKEQSKKIELLEIKIKSLEDGIKERENLKNLLDLKKSIAYHSLASKVIGRTTDNWHKQIILDKGSNFQIMAGDSVLSKNGVIGQIVEVNKNTSIVQLISDPSYKIGCKVSPGNILGILSGKTNSTGLLEFIPVGTKIMAGDLVVTSGIANNDLFPAYPGGHPLGKVIKVSKRKSKQSDLYIEVKLSEDLNSLSNVLVFSPK